MIKTFRFVNEYSNYIDSRIKKADIPEAAKQEYTRQNELIIASLRRGMITLNDCMHMLVNLDKVIHDIEFYG